MHKKIIFLTVFLLALNFGASAQQDSLKMFRKQIDSIDYQIISLFGARMELVNSVGIYKAIHHIAPLQSKRFEEILQKNIILGREVKLSEAFIRELMEAIHKESLAKEKALQRNSKL